MKVFKFNLLTKKNEMVNVHIDTIESMIEQGILELQIEEHPNTRIGKVLKINEDNIEVLVPDDIIFAYGLENYEYTVNIKFNNDYGYYIRLYSIDGNEINCHHSKISSRMLNECYSLYVKKNKNKKNLLPTCLVRYHKELYPDMMEIKIDPHGDFIDLRSAERVELKAGEFKLISLGVSIKLPEGYWGQFVPRSSTFKNYGIIQTNSFAVIDEVYCGDNDIWRMPVYATRNTVIETNDRICQFRIVKKQPFNLETVEKLENKNRGGFGSSGRK